MAEHSETSSGPEYKSQATNLPSLFDGFYALRLILRHKWFILITGVLAGVVAGVVVFRMPNIYSTMVSIVPPKKAGGGMDGILGSVASTLKDIGFARVGANKGGGGYDPIVILFSRSLKDSIIIKHDLLNAYKIPQNMSADSAMFYARQTFEENLQVDFQPEGNYTITVSDTDPARATRIANDVVVVANQIAQQLDRDENSVLLKQFDDRIAATERKMAMLSDSLTRYARVSLVYSPLDQAKAAASALAESKAQMLQQEVGLQLLEQQYGSEDPRTDMQRQLVSQLRTKVSDMEKQPGFIGNFSLKDAPAAAYDYLRFYTELETMMKLKAMLVPSYEQTKLDQVKYAPALYVLDNAVLPVKKDSPKRASTILAAFASGLFLAIVLKLLQYQYKNLRRKFQEYAIEE